LGNRCSDEKFGEFFCHRFALILLLFFVRIRESIPKLVIDLEICIL